MTTTTVPLPTPRRLAVTTLLAAAGAAVILMAFVLPAEYAIDPLGTGRLLGLTRIAAPPAAPEEPIPPGSALVPAQNGPIGTYPTAYRSDSTQFVLGPYDFVEYKYRLEQGATMVYAWTSTTALIHEFHGDPAATPDAPVSYDKKTRRESTGTFTAPFAGIHGWYWENPGADPVTITLHSSGFYSSATEFRSDRTRRTHEVAPPK